MKQLLFLLLFPCLCVAQYQGNAGQKITLGEQTTADGLVYRGVASADTIRKPSIDTMAFILLDTNTNIIWQYKKAINNAWTRVGGSISSGVTGVLPVANGGTGQSTLAEAGIVTSGGNGTLNYIPRFTGGTTQLNSNIFQSGSNVGINTTTFTDFPNPYLHILGANTTGMVLSSINGSSFFQFVTLSTPNAKGTIIHNNGFRFARATGRNVEGYTDIMTLDTTYRVGIGILAPTEKLHVVGNARITAMNGINDIGASATGVLQAATSDMNLKNTIEDSPFGLNEILLLKPVTFLYNDENRKIDSDVKEVGFIAQDVFDIIPNAVSSTGIGDLQLDYRAITATLTKAIQEQQALIKALEQRILTLENK